MADVPPPSLRATIQQLVSPLCRHGLQSVHSAEEGSGDGGVYVGVSATHHGIDDSLLKAWRMEKLPQRILERYEHPALLADVLRRWTRRRINDCLHQWSFHFHLGGPSLDLSI